MTTDLPTNFITIIIPFFIRHFIKADRTRTYDHCAYFLPYLCTDFARLVSCNQISLPFLFEFIADSGQNPIEKQMSYYMHWTRVGIFIELIFFYFAVNDFVLLYIISYNALSMFKKGIDFL